MVKKNQKKNLKLNLWSVKLGEGTVLDNDSVGQP